MALLAAAGCARLPLREDATVPGWRGRLALRVEGEAPQSLLADFELQGQAEQGALRLSGALGVVLADLQWTPTSAVLRAEGQVRQERTVAELVRQVIGTEFPLAALFDWLAGVAREVEGWQVDLSALAQGRLTARRVQPAPLAELRLLLEP